MYAAGCCLRTFSIAAAPCFLKSAASASRKSLLNDLRVASKDAEERDYGEFSQSPAADRDRNGHRASHDHEQDHRIGGAVARGPALGCLNDRRPARNFVFQKHSQCLLTSSRLFRKIAGQFDQALARAFVIERPVQGLSPG